MRLHPAALSAVILSSMLRTKNAFVVVTTSLRSSSTSSAFVALKQSSIVSYRYKPTSFALSRQNFHLFSLNSKSNHDLERESSSSSSSSSYDVQNAKNGITGSYNPAEFESIVYEWWEKNGCFDPDAVGKNLGVKSEQPAYVLPMPPVSLSLFYFILNRLI